MATRTYWKAFVYLILITAGLNFLAHGLQDPYSTYLSNQLHYDTIENAMLMVISQISAMADFIFFGRCRLISNDPLILIFVVIYAGVLVPAYIFVRNHGLYAAVFFNQIFVLGSWGTAPIFLLKIAPKGYGLFASDISYQLGNSIASVSSTTERRSPNERFTLRNETEIF